MLDSLVSLVQGNQFLSGGLVLVIIGGLLAYFRNLPRKLYRFFERFFITRVEIMDDDEAYQWMKAWLADRMSGTLSVSVTTRQKKKEEIDDEDYHLRLKPDNNRPVILFVPAPGTYFMWFERRLCVVSRTRSEQAQTTGESAGLKMHESFEIRILSRKREIAKRLIESARDLSLPDDGKIDIRIATHSYWQLAGRIRPRSFDSVILDGNDAKNMLDEVKKFRESQEWYDKLGIPYRLGVLLYGPPGNGKTSFVKALASALHMNIFVLNLSARGLSDHTLNNLLLQVSDNSIILMEDVDCAFVKRESKRKGDGMMGDHLTFSGLLNALDGIAAQDGRIVVMTTNRKSKLDPALIRPGRADIHLHIDNATKDQAHRLFSRFYDSRHPDLAHAFAEAVPDRKLSMAFLQAHLMSYKDSPNGAVDRLCESIRKHEAEVQEETENLDD